MTSWLNLTNIHLFRQMLVNEPNSAKRQELERKLDKVEAQVNAATFNNDEPPARAA
jgi:hypothetical protein